MPEGEAISRITAGELKKRLDEGEKIYLLDVRRHPDDFQIPGAVYDPPEEILNSPRVELPVSPQSLIVCYCT